MLSVYPGDLIVAPWFVELVVRAFLEARVKQEQLCGCRVDPGSNQTAAIISPIDPLYTCPHSLQDMMDWFCAIRSAKISLMREMIPELTVEEV